MFMFFARIYPWRVCITIFALFIASILEAVGIAFFLPIFMDLLQDNNSNNIISDVIHGVFSRLGITQNLFWLLSFMVLLMALKFVVSYRAMREVGRTAAKVTSYLRGRFVCSILGARWSYFTGLAAGRAASAMSSEAERASLAYLTLCILISDVALVMVYLVFVTLISWQVSVAAIFVGGLVFFLMRTVVRQTRDAGRAQTSHLNILLSKLSDSLGAVKPIKAMAREDHYSDLMQDDIERLYESHKKRFQNREFSRLIKEPLLILFMAIGLYVGIEIMNVALASLMLMAMLFLRMAMKAMNFQTLYQQLSEHESGFWSFLDLIERSEEQKEEHKGDLQPSFAKTLVLKDVCFSHGAQSVLKDVSLTFEQGKFYALVGQSGSGKTTLIDIIIGLYTPHSGVITIDESQFDQIDVRAWRECVGYVPQDCILLNDSLFNNVTLGDDRFTDQDVEAALKKAGAWDFVESLEDGLQTNVGERGTKFSGGQRQRIAIARALIQSPALMILDEPGSALDQENEKALMETLQGLTGGSMTLIVISHNDEIRKYAGHVITLHNGQVIRQEDM